MVRSNAGIGATLPAPGHTASKKQVMPSTCKRAGYSCRLRLQRLIAEPGHREKDSVVRLPAVRRHTRHCHGLARLASYVISCPPNSSGISSRSYLRLAPEVDVLLLRHGAESESRSPSGPQEFAPSVTCATHQAMSATSSSCALIASPMPLGTRCSRTDCFASRSASSLPCLSMAVRSLPLPIRLQPTSAVMVCACIHETS